jgi:hypothetical protein
VNTLQLFYLIGFIICFCFVFFLLVAHPIGWWRIEKRTHILDVIKQSLNSWTSRGGGKNTMQRFIEMKCLQEYLQYLQQIKEYDANKANATKSFNKKKIKCVLHELKKIDQHIKINEESSKWG